MPHGTPLTNQFAEAGVTFSSEAEAGVSQSTDPGDATGRFSAPAYVYGTIGPAAGTPTSGSRYVAGRIGSGMTDIRVDFLSGVSAFGMYLIDNDSLAVRLQAFDDAGKLLETLLVPRVLDGVSTYSGIDVSSMDALISYFILDAAEGGAIDNWFIDDLSFRTAEAQPAPVPLPASLPLLVAGVAGLGYLKRRRKA